MASVASGQNGAKRTSTVASNRFSVAGTDMQALAWEDDSDLLQTDSILSRSRAAVRRAEEQLFGLLYLMTKDRKKMFNNKASNIVLLLVDFLQFLFFILSPDFPWYIKFDVIQHLSQMFQLSFSDLPAYFFLPLYLSICGCILTMIALSFRVAMATRRSNQNVQVIIALRAMVSLFITLGYIPFLRVVVIPMDCVIQDGQFVLDMMTDVKCFEGLHVAMFLLSVVVVLTFVPFALLMSLVYFDSHPQSSNYLSRATNRVDFIYTICRTIVVLVATFLTGQLILRVLVVFAANAVMLCAYLYYPPYHRKQANCIRATLFSIGTLASFIAVITVIVDDEESFATLVVLATLVIPVAIMAFRFAATRYERLIKIVTTLHNPSDPTSFKFRNYRDVEFASRYYLRKSSEEDEVSTMDIETTRNIYKKGMISFPNSAVVRVQYSLFLLAFCPAAAITEVRVLIVEMMRMKDMALDVRFLVYNLRSMWQQDMETRGLGQRGGLDLISYIDFKKKLSIAKRYHKEARKSLYTFWKILQRQNVTQEHLEKQAEEFEKMEQTSLTAYENLLARYFNSPDLLRNYGSFWMDLYRDTNLSNVCYLIADEIEEHENKKASMRSRKSLHQNVALDEAGKETGSSADEKDEKESKAKSQYTSSSSSRSRERMKKMRMQLDRIKKQTNAFSSTAVRNFSILLFFLQILLFVVPIVAIAIYIDLDLELEHNEMQLNSVHLQSFLGNEVLYSIQSIALVSLWNRMPDLEYYNCRNVPSCNEKNEELHHYLDDLMKEFQHSHVEVFKEIELRQAGVLHTWLDPHLNLTIYHNTTMSIQRIFNLLDANDFLSGNADRINDDPDPFRDWFSDPRFLFCEMNGKNIMVNGYNYASKAQVEHADEVAHEFLIYFAYMSGVTFAFFLIAAVLWRPIYAVVLKEVSALRFVKAINQEDVQQLCNLYRFVDRYDDEDDDNEDRANANKNVESDYTFYRKMAMVTVFIAMCGVFVVMFTSIFAGIEPVHYINKAGERINLAFMSDYAIRGLLEQKETVTEKDIQAPLSMLEDLQGIHDYLVHHTAVHSEQEDLLFKSCPSSGAPGLNQRLTEYLSIQRRILINSVGKSHEHRLRLAKNLPITHEGDALKDCMKDSRELMHKTTKDMMANSFAVTNAYFWIIWPIFFVMAGWSVPIGFRRQVIGASSRSRRMLRMIPVEIVAKYREMSEYMIEKGIIEGINLDDQNMDNQQENENVDGDVNLEDEKGTYLNAHGAGVFQSERSLPSAAIADTTPLMSDPSLRLASFSTTHTHTHGSNVPTVAPFGSSQSLWNRMPKGLLWAGSKQSSTRAMQMKSVLSKQSSLQQSNGADFLSMGRICVMCHANTRDVLLYPCGHFLFCYACIKPHTICPKCGEAIQRKEII